MEIAFECSVSEAGYEALDAAAFREVIGEDGKHTQEYESRFVVERDGKSPERRVKLPAFLFRRFAALPQAEGELLRFSERFGLPRKETVFPLGEWTDNWDGDTSPPEGYPLDEWRLEIDDMQAACRLWDGLREGRIDEGALNRVGIRRFWGEDGRSRERDERASSASISQVMRRLHPSGGQEVDPVDDAWRWLYVGINQRLKKCDFTFARTAWHPRRRLLKAAGVNAEDTSVQDQKWALMLQPPDLLSALWAQFAFAVESDQGYKQCQRIGCPNWFPVGLDTSRSHREYCSNACRQRAWREANPGRRRRQ